MVDKSIMTTNFDKHFTITTDCVQTSFVWFFVRKGSLLQGHNIFPLIRKLSLWLC